MAHNEYPIPTRLNVLIILAQLAAIVGCFYGATVIVGWGQRIALAAVFGAVMNSVYSSIHEAEHGLLFPGHRLNAFAGAFMALFFPAPFHLIRQGHLGHHLRNRSDDEAFDCVFEGEHLAWKRIQFYGILTGAYWAMVALGNVVVLVAPSILNKRKFKFDKSSAALMESLNPTYWRLIRFEALAAILLHSAIIWLVGIPFLNYAVMYYGFGFSWSAMQYVHHFGTERHVTRGTRNLWIWKPLDLIWLNHNWHRAHHENPMVPWTFLPALGREEDSKRGFLPWAYLRMWRGPRHTDEHVENKYAGRVIR